MQTKLTTRNRPSRRRTRGAVMMETVLILPFIMVTIVLIIYLGWNFRRLSQVTNLDRYEVWDRATPGAPGPGVQGLPGDMRNPRLDTLFYGLHDDGAQRLDEDRPNDGYTPQGHEDLRDSQADETFSYFDEFLNRNPRAIGQRFEATHTRNIELIRKMGLSELTRNGDGHSRMDGEWRYLNGIAYNGSRSRWEPAFNRVAPGPSLREVFFAELDDGLEPYDSNGNELAKAIREFYISYPVYIGPDVRYSANNPTGNLFNNRNRRGN